jgi:hypothetical protein
MSSLYLARTLSYAQLHWRIPCSGYRPGPSWHIAYVCVLHGQFVEIVREDRTRASRWENITSDTGPTYRYNTTVLPVLEGRASPFRPKL